MRYSASIGLFLALVVLPATCQIGSRQGDDGKVYPPSATSANHVQQDNGIDLLKSAEGEAAGLRGGMRAWVLWQIGIGYQSSNKRKALELFQNALVASHSFVADASAEKRFAEKEQNELMARITRHPALSPALQLQSDIARSIVFIEPKRSKQVLEQIDPEARSPVLAIMLSQQLNEKQFDKARETLNRLALEDEIPYYAAMRLMETLKPAQSAELTQLFLAALGSYRSHAPHPQMNDEFVAMMTHYWRRLPQGAVRQGVDEVLKQAGDDGEKSHFTALSPKGAATANSLYEYRLLQLMPMLRGFDPSAAKSYQEKYPALASGNLPDPDASSVPKGAQFRPSPGSGIMLAAAETPAAQRAAAAADSGHGDEAMSHAAGIRDPNLRAQTYEYIARVSAKLDASTAGHAIEKMLDATGKLDPDQAFTFYVSGAEIYAQMGETDGAKNSIEHGLDVANELLKSDSDDDDPNTALKAFWPSTNAFCKLLREAARISPPWAISQLRTIQDQEVRVSAETALAGGWLGAPIGPNTMITSKKGSSSFSMSGRQ